MNYKTIKDIEVDINEDISLIIGKNNIGKSNVLKAVELFFKNIITKETIVNIEDFRYQSKVIRIRVTFSNIKEYIENIENTMKMISKKARVNQQELKEYENEYKFIKLFEKEKEVTIELKIQAQDLKNEKQFSIITKISENARNEYKKYIKIREILEEHKDMRKNYIKEESKWYEYEKINLTNENILIWKEEEYKFKNIEKIEKIENLSDDYYENELIKLIQKTQKFLYIPAYRGGKNERESAINKIFDIIIDEIVDKRSNSNEYDIIANALWGSGRNGNKENCLESVTKGRMDLLRDALKLESISNISDISFKEYEKNEIKRQILRILLGTSNIMLNDGIETSFESKGTGIQSSFMISLMKALSNIEFRDSLNIILVIEEPEAFTHPQLTREIIEKIIETNKESKYQFILTTHSPVIVNYIDAKKIQRFTQEINAKQKETKNITNKSISISNSDWNLINRMSDLNMSEIVFADYVIFVEGEGDRICLQNILKYLIPNKIHQISIISLGGCEQILRTKKLLDFFNLKWIFIVDKDSLIEKEIKSVEVDLQNIDEISEQYELRDSAKENWEKVLKNNLVKNIKIEFESPDNLKHAALFKRINELTKSDIIREKSRLFKLISDSIQSEFVIDEKANEILRKFNEELYKLEIPIFSLISDLEGFIINKETFAIAESIYEKYWNESYKAYVVETELYEKNLKLECLRRKLGSKTFQLKKPSKKALEKKKPHIPIEIIGNYLESLSSSKENTTDELYKAFPSLRHLVEIIEKEFSL